MDQHYEEKFFESVIKEEEKQQYYLISNSRYMDTDSYQYTLDGMREVIRLYAIQVGKPMLESETIKDYYQRWLSMEYAQTRIPDKMSQLEKDEVVK